MAAKVVVDRLVLGTPRHDVVVKLAPLAVAARIDEADVVAAVIVAAVHEDRM